MWPLFKNKHVNLSVKGQLKRESFAWYTKLKNGENASEGFAWESKSPPFKTFAQSKVPIEVKPAFPNGSNFHCCKQGTLFQNLNIAKKLHGLPLKTHAVG